MTEHPSNQGSDNIIRLDDSDFPPQPSGNQPGGGSAPHGQPQRIEITEDDLRNVNRTNGTNQASPPQGNRIVLRPEDFEQPPPHPPARPAPTARPPVAPTTTGTATAAGGASSGLAAFFKALMLFLFLGAAGTAGFYAVKEYGLLDNITMLGASPSAVVREYLERTDEGRDASSLLTDASQEFYAGPGNSGPMARLKQMMGNDKEGQEMAAGLQTLFNDPEFQKMQREVHASNKQKSKWSTKSEKIEGDKAWVLVETENPMAEYFGDLEARIEYNKAHGQEDAARLNQEYLDQQKKRLGGDKFAEGMHNFEQPVLCKFEGGRWKVDLTGQMDTMLQNLDKLFEGTKDK